jgi:polyisoprenoid-binding protein YceI
MPCCVTTPALGLKPLAYAILTVIATLWVVGTAFGADTYVPDDSHTTVGFTVRHFVITKVRGRFSDFSATIVYDGTDITKSSMQGTIKTASIDTGNDKRDADLRSANFFDVAKYPEITFQTTRVEKRGDGYVLMGPLTIHGVTRDVEVPFVVSGKLVDTRGKERIGFEATLKLDRRDFGLTWDKRMDSGGLVVSDTVEIELVVEAIKQ